MKAKDFADRPLHKKADIRIFATSFKNINSLDRY